MRTINILHQYHVYIKSGLFNQFLHNIDQNYLIIKDENIDINCDYIISLPFSEQTKNLATVNQLYDLFIDHNVSRETSTIVAVGGGVTLDVVGYAAATFKRGIRVIYVPTTLLSMVDASVGGKTGVNYQGLKNYIGCFYQPSCVIIDPEFLQTLDQRQFNNGMAEVIKYGCIKDKRLLNDIMQPNLDIEDIIERCVNIKKYFVEQDEHDHHVRHALNFGHTYGHAIESYYQFDKYLHGEAISIGMNMKCDDPLLKAVCEYYHLPTTLEDEIDLTNLMLKDKKNEGGIKLVKLKELGEIDI